MNAMTHSMAHLPAKEIPSWLSIVRLDDRRYQVTDISVASIGFCLGIFPCREAAESIAAKIAQSRARSSSPSLVQASSVGAFGSFKSTSIPASPARVPKVPAEPAVV